jgi:hypothetical protein
VPATHITSMAKLGVMGILAIVALLALLAAALWYAFGIWIALEDADMPPGLYAAMAGGILFSLLVGCGLMALMFYSSRHGYDEQADGIRRRE